MNSVCLKFFFQFCFDSWILIFKIFALVPWGFHVYLDHDDPFSPSSSQIYSPFSYNPQLWILFTCLFVIKTNLWCLNISEYVTFHWSMFELSKATPIKKIESYFSSATKNSQKLLHWRWNCFEFICLAIQKMASSIVISTILNSFAHHLTRGQFTIQH